MKKMLMVILTASMLFVGVGSVFAESEYSINGHEINKLYATMFSDEQGNPQSSFIMLPLREVVENGLGYKLGWDPATMTATVTTIEDETTQKIGNVIVKKKIYPEKTLKFTAGSGIIEISDGTSQAEYTIPDYGKVQESDDKLYVPDKAIIDVFGLENKPIDE